MWYAEDTATKGNWVGKYGSYAHILPNAPVNTSETPIGYFSAPLGFNLSDSSTWHLLNETLWPPDDNWTAVQVAGLAFYKQNVPYYDEYVSQSPQVTYYVNGTHPYPVFEWAWESWHATQTGLREVYYTTSIPGTGNGPGWRFCCWDDGGERCSPEHGYMNFTMHFPQGVWLLSLYAYDYQTDERFSQIYRIYNETGALLDSKHIEGATFDNGVYESFKVVAPDAGGLTIIVQVYNDAGHGTGPGFPPDKTVNLALSGIFVDQLPPTGGFLFEPDKPALLEYIGLSITLIVPSALIVYIVARKKKQK